MMLVLCIYTVDYTHIACIMLVYICRIMNAHTQMQVKSSNCVTEPSSSSWSIEAPPIQLANLLFITSPPLISYCLTTATTTSTNFITVTFTITIMITITMGS